MAAQTIDAVWKEQDYSCSARCDDISTIVFSPPQDARDKPGHDKNYF
jgi:hypothetical protein